MLDARGIATPPPVTNCCFGTQVRIRSISADLTNSERNSWQFMIKRGAPQFSIDEESPCIELTDPRFKSGEWRGDGSL